MFAANVILAVSFLAATRSVLSEGTCDKKEKLSLKSVEDGLFWMSNIKPVKDNKHIKTKDTNVKISVGMTGGSFHMISAKVRTLRVSQIHWVCRDFGESLLFEDIINLSDKNGWQVSKVDEEFYGCAYVEAKFKKDTNADEMEIKAMTMTTCRITCDPITELPDNVQMDVNHPDTLPQWGTGTCVSFSCPSGYNLDGDDNFCCVDEELAGHWEELIPSCIEESLDPTYVGCYHHDEFTDRTDQLVLQDMTHEKCTDHCKSKNKIYAILNSPEMTGTYYYTCLCGNTWVSSGSTLTCEEPCGGDVSQMCGSKGYGSTVYRLNYTS